MNENTDLKFSKESWELAQAIASGMDAKLALGARAKEDGEALAEFFIAFLTKINSATGPKSHAE